jgi:elongation factor 1-gamma
MLLYTYPENFRAYKALIAAQFSGANLKVDQKFVFGTTNKSEAFLKKFPLGKVSISTSCQCKRVIISYNLPNSIEKIF